MKKTKRKPPAKVRHLWQVKVRHRDYPATMNSLSKQLIMKETELWIPSPQPPTERPNVELALVRARRFLMRNRRQYGIPNIQAVIYHGFLDVNE